NIYQVSNKTATKINSLNVKNNGAVRLTGHQASGKLYALFFYFLNSGKRNSDIYGSNDGGNSWSYRGSVEDKPFMTNSFACSCINSDTVYFGGIDGYRSIDGCRNWTKINKWSDYYKAPSTKLHADIPGINSFKDIEGKEIVLISTDGGVYVSNDSLKTVKNKSLANLKVSQYYSVYSDRNDSNFIHVGSQDQGYQTAKNLSGKKAVKFKQHISGDYGHLVSGDDGKSIWMSYIDVTIYFYPDAENPKVNYTWDVISKDQLWMPPLMVDPEDPNKVYLGGGGIKKGSHLILLTYQNKKITHKELSFDFSKNDNAKISAMASSPLNSNYRYVMTSTGNFFASVNGGQSWELTSGFSGPEGHYFYGSYILPSSSRLGDVYIAGSGYSPGVSPVYKSFDNGKTFSPMSDGLPKTLVHGLAATPNENLIFAATEVGPYVYSPSSAKWEELAENKAPDQVYWSVDYVHAFNKVRFGTMGRGIWEFTLY
ncbi:MAG: hypothetical protein MUO43_01060, partial [Desulfobacterales bacterium]|nr:hypothetical protein [Desulfobacterales bacterium]